MKPVDGLRMSVLNRPACYLRSDRSAAELSGQDEEQSRAEVVPAVWIEQTTYRLQGGCSTTELNGHKLDPQREETALHFAALIMRPT